MGEVINLPRRQPETPAWLALLMAWPMVCAMLPVVAAGALARAWLAMHDERNTGRLFDAPPITSRGVNGNDPLACP